MSRLGAAVLLVMCVTLTTCSDDRDQRRAEVSTTTTGPHRNAFGQSEGQYDPGDCVTWEAGTLPVPATTEVVPCEQPHRVQIVTHLGSPQTSAGAYPSKAEWDQHEKDGCWPAVERFLGRPLDPYGRYTIGTLIPNIVEWTGGDRDVWCGIWLNAPDDALHAGDVRQAHQATDYAPGTCVAGDKTREIEVVSCTQPHLMEVVERLAYDEEPEMPGDRAHEALRQRCAEAVDDYVGGSERLSAPWATGLERMHPASWQAGTRTVHCFLGQVDTNHEWIPVTEPVPR